jgi:uncharacterized protein (TIGR03086 family)
LKTAKRERALLQPTVRFASLSRKDPAMTFPVLTASLEQLRRVTAGIPAGRLDDPTPCPHWTVAQVLLHAAGDQHAWASCVGSSPLPSYDPFAPPRHLDATTEDLIGAAIEAATTAWANVGPTAETVRTPLPPLPTMTPELAAGACALDAAIHAWDIAAATGRSSGA